MMQFFFFKGRVLFSNNKCEEAFPFHMQLLAEPNSK